MQTFTAPVDGNYKLEVWGASGWTWSFHGLGGYSTGYYPMESSQIIYVCCGGQGREPSGGYNGGGRGGSSTVYPTLSGCGGGGATHIASTNHGILNNYETYKSDIIIVAGGGGGTTINGRSGSGGGISGAAGYINGNELKNLGGDQTSGYAFGQGQSGGSRTVGHSAGDHPTGGAGGGWYGGFANTYVGENTDIGAGGGSGYIGHSLLTNKHMAGYEVETSNDVDTKTISVSVSSSDPIADYAKDGDGYAIITWQQLPQ